MDTKSLNLIVKINTRVVFNFFFSYIIIDYYKFDILYYY